MLDNQGEIAVFGGGCFWCTEAVFAELNGVMSVVPGYAGGHVANPSYRDVCTDETGHAESVKIEFDSGQISYDRLLEVFFATHDPTTLNRQGADRGTHYRSLILYDGDDQKTQAEAFIQGLERSGVDLRTASGIKVFSTGDVNRIDTYKVRRGKVGGYQDVLPQDLANHYERRITAELDDSYGYSGISTFAAGALR